MVTKKEYETYKRIGDKIKKAEAEDRKSKADFAKKCKAEFGVDAATIKMILDQYYNPNVTTNITDGE